MCTHVQTPVILQRPIGLQPSPQIRADRRRRVKKLASSGLRGSAVKTPPLPIRMCVLLQNRKRGQKKPDLNAIRAHRGDRKARRARAAEQDQAVQVSAPGHTQMFAGTHPMLRFHVGISMSRGLHLGTGFQGASSPLHAGRSGLAPCKPGVLQSNDILAWQRVFGALHEVTKRGLVLGLFLLLILLLA